MNRDASSLLALALCAASRRLDAWSRLLAALALLACALPVASPLWAPTLAAALGCGLLQLFCSLRLAFDQPVFAHWSGTPADSGTLAAFDAALAALGKAPPPGRSLGQRLAGVRRLLRRQLLAFGGQLAATLGAVLLLLAA